MSVLLLALPDNALAADQLDEVRRLAPELEVVVTEDRERMEGLREAVTIAAGWIPSGLLVRMPRLRWVQQWSAGADWLRKAPEAQRQRWQLTSTSGIHATQIAEHIFAMLLAFARRLPDAIRHQAAGEWQPMAGETLFELGGKRLLIVGVGAIGARTAEVAVAWGMEVVGVRNDPSRSVPHVSRMVGPSQLREELAGADAVVMTVPLTDQTKGMIGEEELRAMKAAAILINIGRGGTVDEEALARALREGWIGGAGLDVFEEEPLPDHSPLWGAPNLILTAHYAGATPHYHQRAFAIFRDNLRRFQAGEPLCNLIDKERGY